MATYAEMKEKNKHISIYHVNDLEFSSFGKRISGIDFTELTNYMETTEVPKQGNIYVASVENMENTEIKNKLKTSLYGEMDIQIGYCNGANSHLNGLEYHKGSELNIAITSLVLLVGEVGQITNNSFSVENVKAFYVPEGTMVELYQTTLHFAPCKIQEDGFKCVVVLPKGTNTPINLPKQQLQNEDRLLFMKNKWLLAHPERTPLVEKGAYPGIIGENIEIYW